MEDYDKNKESSYLNYCDVNDLYGWAMSQKLPVNNFEWIEENSQFNEDFIKTYNEESEFFFQYPEKNIYELDNDLPFLHERKKLKKAEKPVTNLYDKTECYTHKKFKTSNSSWIKFEKIS